MPQGNPKNDPISQVWQDLGLGDLLQGQQQDETEEQRKKRLQLAQMNKMAPGLSGGVVTDLYGG